MGTLDFDFTRLVPVSPTTTLDRRPAGSVVVHTGADGGQIQGTPAPGGHPWSDYQYLALEVEHDSHDVLVIILEFSGSDASGQPAASVQCHFGVLPGISTRLIFPLQALDGESLFLRRPPGVLQMVLRGGPGIAREMVTALTIGTVPSIRPREFTIHKLYFTTTPGSAVDRRPLVDSLGQWQAKDWAGKVRAPEDLVEALQASADVIPLAPDSGPAYDAYGGSTELHWAPTGFFRTQYDGSRWWLVDPLGNAFISTGFDCVHPGEAMDVETMGHLAAWLPAKEGPYAAAWQANGRGFNFGMANLIRAFGSEAWSTWARMTKARMQAWGVNTIGPWSDPDFIASARLPYVLVLKDFPQTRDRVFRDFPDVFSPEYQEASDVYAQQLLAHREDPQLIGYFLRNEPHWAFIDQLNLGRQLLLHPKPLASKTRLIEFLKGRYEGDIDRLNQAWQTALATFDSLLEPLPEASTRSLHAEADLQAFTRLMIAEYVRVPALACRQIDTHHLNLGMRYAWISSDGLFAGSEYFDVYSINCYQPRPDPQGIARITEQTGLPVLIGEFHHGAADGGLLASGIRGVADQAERARAYRYFVEQGAALPSMVGMHYFQWNDQPALGRFDGENYQIGAVDVCQQPYTAFVEGVRLAQERLYAVAQGTAMAYSEPPKEIPKTGF